MSEKYKSKKTYRKISFKSYIAILFFTPVFLLFVLNKGKSAFAEEKNQDIIIPKADLQNIKW